MEQRQFEHIISLGSFCGVAQELERLGLRDASYPFDWLITSSIYSLQELIENNFENFLNPDWLYQEKNFPHHYVNSNLGLRFYHDFNEKASLSSQIDAVTSKYIHRIQRFYSALNESTLLIRYFHRSDEVVFWEKNYETVLKYYKNICRENELLLISDDSLDCSKIPTDIYYVKKDTGDIVARRFIKKNPALSHLLTSDVLYSAQKRERNLTFFKKKRNRPFKEVKRKIKNKTARYCKHYTHGRQV